jgi:hypothetical protein
MSVFLASTLAFVLAPILVCVAWVTVRRRQWLALLGTVSLFSAACAYLGYRLECGIPLHCDLGGVNYLIEYGPTFALEAASVFAVSIVVVLFLQRIAPSEPLWPKPLAIGGLATIGVWAVISHALYAEVPYLASLRSSGSVRGAVVSESGTPIQRVEVELIPISGRSESVAQYPLTDWTDARGQYAFPYVDSGRYVVAVHKHVAPTASVPFVGVYYPGVVEQTAAESITVIDSDAITLRPVRLRRMATATVRVNVMFEDGVRPESSNLLFHNPQFPNEAVIGSSAPEVEAGRGSMTLPVGFEYEANASVQCDAGTRIEQRESKPVQRVGVVSDARPDELTFVIPGRACKLWVPR